MSTIYVQGVNGMRNSVEISVVQGTIWLDINRDGLDVRVEMNPEQLQAMYYKVGAFLQDQECHRERCERHGFRYDPSVDAEGPVMESELLRRQGTIDAVSDAEIIRRAGF